MYLIIILFIAFDFIGPKKDVSKKDCADLEHFKAHLEDCGVSVYSQEIR